MRKRILLFLLALAIALSACASPAKLPVSDTAVTFTDDLGREITVDNPQNVAALLGSFAQIWMLAGGDVSATAEDAWKDLSLELPESTVNLGHTKRLSLELLLAAKPDLVLASVNTQQQLQWKDTLEAAGITVAYFDIGDFEDYLRMLNICTGITGRSDLYEKNGLAVQSQIDEVLKRSGERLKETPAPSVLCLVASASSISAKNSRGNVLGEMLCSLGCINIADSETSLLETLSLEHIVLADPTHIFIVQRGDDTAGTLQNLARELESNPLWSRLTAVQEGRVHLMEKNLYNLKPNHRWGEAYERLEAILANEEI